MIYNKHRPQHVPKDAVLVDRTTKYGNHAYRMKTATRTERLWAMLAFARYLKSSPELIADIRKNLRGRDLVCWCTPFDCHAEIIQGVAIAENPIEFLEHVVVKYAHAINKITADNRPRRDSV